jgi:L-ascorbate metabolism protein UlaG (beta-lactamase superfamily)
VSSRLWAPAALAQSDRNPGTRLILLGTKGGPAGVPLSALRYIFITHHHSDHNLEYGSVLYNGLATGLANQVDA